MDKTRTVGQKWLANEPDLHFLTLKNFTKGQSNRSILSKVILLTNYKSTDRHTDRYTCRQTHSRKPFFRVQRVSKRGHLTKTWGVTFCINLIPSLMRLIYIYIYQFEFH